MPEDPEILGEALEKFDLELIGGVVFRAYHDEKQWEDVLGWDTQDLQSSSCTWGKASCVDRLNFRKTRTYGRKSE